MGRTRGRMLPLGNKANGSSRGRFFPQQHVQRPASGGAAQLGGQPIASSTGFRFRGPFSDLGNVTTRVGGGSPQPASRAPVLKPPAAKRARKRRRMQAVKSLGRMGVRVKRKRGA